jgi:hypothetical protein
LGAANQPRGRRTVVVVSSDTIDVINSFSFFCRCGCFLVLRLSLQFGPVEEGTQFLRTLEARFAHS